MRMCSLWCIPVKLVVVVLIFAAVSTVSEALDGRATDSDYYEVIVQVPRVVTNLLS